jgi:eukaryotic-like serine/threonine-protein kinase
MKLKVVSMIIIGMLFISSCGPGQLLGPSLIPTSTNTPTPTNTQTPTITLTAALSSTVTEMETQTQTTMLTNVPTFTLNQTLESTQVIVFQPKGVPTQERAGSCWEGSVFLNRDDAWRCTSGDIIYDPCFSIPGSSQAVICDTSPLDNSTGFKLNLTEPMPAPWPISTNSASTNSAWVFELADGTNCRILGGATGAFGGKRVNYSCADGWYVLGDLQKGKVWIAQKIRLSPDFSSIVETVKSFIRIVWF